MGGVFGNFWMWWFDGGVEDYSDHGDGMAFCGLFFEFGFAFCDLKLV